MKKNKKVFLDINVVIDFLERSRSRHAQAIDLFNCLILNDYKPCISEDMLTTIFYISKNKTLALEFLKTLVSKWHVLHFGQEAIKKAIDLSIEKGVDLEDVLQCLCARENDCSMLVTSDARFYDCGMKIYTMEEFLNHHAAGNRSEA